ncbi:MAG: aminotransferase class I/II-fold pyridoxal phosphate-dependent enzyme [Pseudonocardiaceae bacterium]
MVVARQVEAVQRALGPFFEVVTQPPPPGGQPVIADFLAGNPQEPTLPGFVEALQRWSVPTSIDSFAYRAMHEPARRAAAASLSAELGVDFAAEDVFLTRGAAGAIALALSAVVDPGDEVIFLSPPWFFYESMIIASGARPVRVRLEPPAFDLDVGAIAAALGPRPRLLHAAGRAGSTRPTRACRGAAGLLPHLADRERRDGDPLPAGLRARYRAGHEVSRRVSRRGRQDSTQSTQPGQPSREGDECAWSRR